MPNYNYYSTLQTIETLLRADPGFSGDGWFVLGGTEPPQVETCPNIQVREGPIDEESFQFPGFASGNQQITVGYKLYMMTYHPTDLAVARQQMQKGWDDLLNFIRANPTLGNTVNALQKYRIVPESGAALGGVVVGAEVTLFAIKLV